MKKLPSFNHHKTSWYQCCVKLIALNVPWSRSALENMVNEATFLGGHLAGELVKSPWTTIHPAAMNSKQCLRSFTSGQLTGAWQGIFGNDPFHHYIVRICKNNPSNPQQPIQQPYAKHTSKTMFPQELLSPMDWEAICTIQNSRIIRAIMVISFRTWGFTVSTNGFGSSLFQVKAILISRRFHQKHVKRDYMGLPCNMRIVMGIRIKFVKALMSQHWSIEAE